MKHLSLLRLYGSDRGVPLTELHSADASKELLEVYLQDLWVGGLTQDLKQFLITDEVVLWEGGSLLLREERRTRERAGVKKRREKRKEMQKAGSHEVRNERSFSAANAQHQCWEVANTRILSSYLKELIECLLAFLELLQEVADSFFKPVFFTWTVHGCCAPPWFNRMLSWWNIVKGNTMSLRHTQQQIQAR